MAWGAIAAAGISAAASILGGREANDATRQSTEAQIAFQREGMQNRYQWTMNDMRRAGLNPILAYQQGGGSAMPGASYQAINEMEGVGDAVNSAYQNMRIEQEMKNMQETNKNIAADTQKKRDESDLIKTQQYLSNVDAILKSEQARYTRATSAVNEMTVHQIEAQIRILREQYQQARTEAERASIEENFYKKYPWAREAGMWKDLINPLNLFRKKP
jgi:hypothetical protein